MSYEPLHHKYRPKSFAQLVGQEAIATTLTNAIGTSKIAPAYLFTGPRGTGKTSSARILAKSLNCLKSDKPTADPCGVCDVCQGITKGYSLDVIEIDAASNTGVDNIRELIEKAQFAPVQCRYKVYVIDECHMLSNQAFNALLKTLEEPPKHVVFVLATTDPQRVLPTIISRCQRFDFRRIQLEAMVKHLSAIASKENINISPDAVTLVAQLAQGGLRDAESLLDQLALLPGEVTPDKVWDLVGTVSEQDLLGLLNAIAQDKPEAVIDFTHSILDRGREPLTILQNLAAFYRDLSIAKTAPNRHDLVACTQQTWKALVEFAQNWHISVILAGQERLRTAEVQIKNSTQPRLWLEVTLLGLLPSANIQPQVSNVPQRVNTPVISPSYTPLSVAQNHPASSVPLANSQTNHNSANNHLAAAQNHPAKSFSTDERQTNQNSTNNHLTAVQNHAAKSFSTDERQTNQNSTSNHLTAAQNHPVASSSADDRQTNHNSASNSVSSATSESLASAEIEPATSEVVETPEYDLTQVWQQVRANFPMPSRQALLGQMCQLIEFNGTVARVAVKGSKWYETLKSDLPMIKAAFQKTFGYEVQVNLEQVTSITSTSARKNPPPKDSTRLQQPTTPISNGQISHPTPAPQPVIAPPVAATPPIKTEPSVRNGNGVNGNGVKTVPPPPTQAPAPNWEPDEVAIAAQRLAEFFNGQVIRFTEDATEFSGSMNTPEWAEESELDDE
ncbi:MAG: DNA polymerase III subunit gamma/tau [Nostoc sp. ChiSLP02]|nr:DNA polymerase III subunit gamma/tau [Nostoc sp. DedSLP05]MDZ8100152.1 DNA polymerase III subunit gamma/tau [Nostoc sp. DedSLP01]MDZ8183300.1 DNA polymerase III subunit gamma/tau [Nostoc sp. ChiSLP02]